ncbi:MAG: Sec-independent protein translocase protein TatB [Alphaproteobacteria bacterium]|nr:Sec-independent protein translocase protein TatB [Alphaproteobacteria bacterium]MBU2377675.1 Sec-independent protein translocase protein TatB [Alphaproteobacteria bacterium]
MGGLGPGIGGLEYLVIGIAALLVVGPERLPGLLRQLGKMVAKVRGMANDFRSSFDEMARQSELDDLRKEVEALRDGKGSVGQSMVRLGDEANAAFKDIKDDLEKVDQAAAAPAPMTLDQPEFPEPAMTPLSIDTAAAPKPRKPRAKGAAPKTGQAVKPRTTKPKSAETAAASKASTPTKRSAKPRVTRKAKLDL